MKEQAHLMTSALIPYTASLGIISSTRVANADRKT
jgi:hypothetical protein